MSRKTPKTKEKIAQLIASLPSDSLRQQAKTPTQIEEWEEQRKTQLLVAECWRAKYLKKGYYPVDDALDRQEICQRKADLINDCVDEYKALWELCKVAEKFVKRLHECLQALRNSVNTFSEPFVQSWYKFFHEVSLKQYPFNSAYDLFVRILKEQVDDTFYICLESYYDVPMKKWRSAAKQYIEIFEKAGPNGIYPELSNKEQRTLKGNLVWNKVGFSWMGMVLCACQIEAKNDPRLRKKLVYYNKAQQEALSLAVTASYRMRGWAWQKGELLETGAGGVYHKP